LKGLDGKIEQEVKRKIQQKIANQTNKKETEKQFNILEKKKKKPHPNLSKSQVIYHANFETFGSRFSLWSSIGSKPSSIVDKHRRRDLLTSFSEKTKIEKLENHVKTKGKTIKINEVNKLNHTLVL
jgi:hypothetical protein